LIDVDVLDERTSTLVKRVDKIEGEDMVRIWEAINGLRNRLPNWAVFVISALTAISGWLVGKVTFH